MLSSLVAPNAAVEHAEFSPFSQKKAKKIKKVLKSSFYTPKNLVTGGKTQGAANMEMFACNSKTLD